MLGLEVVAPDTVPEVVVVGVAGIVPEAVVDIAPVVVVAADTVLAVFQLVGFDMALAVYPTITDQFCNSYLMPSHKFLTDSSIPVANLTIEEEAYLWVLRLLKARYRRRCWCVRWRRGKWWKIRHGGKQKIEFVPALRLQNFTTESPSPLLLNLVWKYLTYRYFWRRRKTKERTKLLKEISQLFSIN